ncbi:prepilin-type N-terminal cleavage/methylation domain-containing protein [Alteromonas sp. 5E99-2]|uniref:prepilin-type N-terminal cleavage/methylation domain-containing protein n=1 Tax=Alteromonas sp. 5E99-2 TaxID=2817683 RepID=UPI001A989708|nr:prepilin-type N-terminal cleavage/methylation domain-containing protein [Alteromonas sp. 5E99-2]MBO1255842.1 prepilin-type N-terminal cleavage/methylation domain-containing protein [Alteromonas sp. 5E99-2]
MRKQTGFTLIELIIVIVILGILAVTAAPRFINLQGDARASTLQGVAAALQGGSQLVFAKAAINGVQATNTSNDLDIDNDGTADLTIINGYPNANPNLGALDVELAEWVDLDIELSTVANPTSAFILTADTNLFTITLNGTAAGEDCEVVYTNADEGEAPNIAVTDTGC